MASRLPTGIDVLDRQLDGGLPAGSVIAYCAPPASQSELLLYELTRARQTLYLTLDRTQESVRDAFERTPAPTGEPTIRQVGADAPLENTRQLFRAIGGEANLILDPSNRLERSDRNRYENFLNELANHMHNTGSVAVLHCLRDLDEPPLRGATEHIADVVLDLRVDTAGSEIETRLAVPKFRGGQALTETIKLELADRVRVDTSRDIA